MQFTQHMDNGQCEVRMSGRLVFDDHDTFRSILSLLDQHKILTLILNFSEIDFIDSAGLGMLLLAKDAAEQHHCRLVIRGASGQVEKMIGISEFDKIFTVEK